MKKLMLSKISYVTVRSVLGIIFLYSGMLKLTDLNAFGEVISAFGLVPSHAKNISAFFISISEVIAGTCLILDIKGSLMAVISMIVVFIAVLIYGIEMGYDIDCGCFGKDDPVGEAFHSLRSALVRDFVLLFFGMYLLICRRITRTKPVLPKYYFKKIVYRD